MALRLNRDFQYTNGMLLSQILVHRLPFLDSGEWIAQPGHQGDTHFVEFIDTTHVLPTIPMPVTPYNFPLLYLLLLANELPYGTYHSSMTALGSGMALSFQVFPHQHNNNVATFALVDEHGVGHIPAANPILNGYNTASFYTISLQGAAALEALSPDYAPRSSLSLLGRDRPLPGGSDVIEGDMWSPF